MHERECASQEMSCRLCSLPYALYESNGLLFELYQGGKSRRGLGFCRIKLRTHEGGQPRRSYMIVWERVGTRVD